MLLTDVVGDVMEDVTEVVAEVTLVEAVEHNVGIYGVVFNVTGAVIGSVCLVVDCTI